MSTFFGHGPVPGLTFAKAASGNYMVAKKGEGRREERQSNWGRFTEDREHLGKPRNILEKMSAPNAC